jgi:hypothetical protein
MLLLVNLDIFAMGEWKSNSVFEASEVGDLRATGRVPAAVMVGTCCNFLDSA